MRTNEMESQSDRRLQSWEPDNKDLNPMFGTSYARF